MNISTDGKVSRSTPAKTDKASGFLFDSFEHNMESDTFKVYPNKAYKITAYGIPDGGAISVHHVSTKKSGIKSGYGCDQDCNSDVVGQSVLYDSPITLGGNLWKLDKNNNILIIVLPGEYRLELSDESMAGEVVVEYEVFDHKWPLPDAYMAGVVPGVSL